MKTISITIDEMLLKKIDILAKVKHYTRAELIRNSLIAFLLDEHDSVEDAYAVDAFEETKNEKSVPLKKVFNR